MSETEALLALAEEQSKRPPQPGQVRLADIAEVTLQT
jgi:hypothetical protein